MCTTISFSNVAQDLLTIMIDSWLVLYDNRSSNNIVSWTFCRVLCFRLTIWAVRRTNNWDSPSPSPLWSSTPLDQPFSFPKDGFPFNSAHQSTNLESNHKLTVTWCQNTRHDINHGLSLLLKYQMSYLLLFGLPCMIHAIPWPSPSPTTAVEYIEYAVTNLPTSAPEFNLELLRRATSSKTTTSWSGWGLEVCGWEDGDYSPSPTVQSILSLNS